MPSIAWWAAKASRPQRCAASTPFAPAHGGELEFCDKMGVPSDGAKARSDAEPSPVTLLQLTTLTQALGSGRSRQLVHALPVQVWPKAASFYSTVAAARTHVIRRVILGQIAILPARPTHLWPYTMLLKAVTLSAFLHRPIIPPSGNVMSRTSKSGFSLKVTVK